MEIAAQDKTVDEAAVMNMGAKVPVGWKDGPSVRAALSNMKNTLKKERKLMDTCRSALMAELKASCASETILSQRESPLSCGAFEQQIQHILDGVLSGRLLAFR